MYSSMEYKVSSEMINLRLRQMGATKIQGSLRSTNLVLFQIDEEFELKYIYNVKDDEVIYLQRLSPYPISRVKFQCEDDVIEFIQEDITTFRNARKSSNFDTFIKLTSTTSQLVETLEDLFLFYNVSKDDFDELTELMDKVHNKLDQIEKNSPKI